MKIINKIFSMEPLPNSFPVNGAELQKYFRVSPKTVRRLIKKGVAFPVCKTAIAYILYI